MPDNTRHFTRAGDNSQMNRSLASRVFTPALQKAWRILRWSKRSFDRIYVSVMKHVLQPRDGERHINIGGGQWYYPRWENIDYMDDDTYVDYKLDLRAKQKLPFQDECAALIFSSHCLEHLSDEDALFTLDECYRIMKPGGLIRIAVPDMDRAFAAYRRNDHEFFDRGGVTCSGEDIEGKLVSFFASYRFGDYIGGPKVAGEEVRKMLREMDKHEFCRWCVCQIPEDAAHTGHVNAFDFAKMRRFLGKSGFAEVERSAYRRSSSLMMRGGAFDVRSAVSLYIEARKVGVTHP